MKTELEKFSDQMALMEMCVQLEDEQKKIFDALPKLKDEFSNEAKAEFARLTKQAEAIEWKLAEARGEYLKTVEANRAEFARIEQSIKAKGTELAEYSKRLQSEVPPPVEQKIKAIFETLPRPANGKDGADGKDASLLTGFRGNWDSDTTYKAGDWFTFRGSSYLVLRACKGQIPTKNVQGELGAYYAVFAMSGAPGIIAEGVYLPIGGGTVPDGFTITGLGSLALTAGGTNESITLTASGSGDVIINESNGVVRNNGYTTLTAEAAGSNAALQFYCSLGTLAAPTQVTGVRSLGDIYAYGRDNLGGLQSAALIQLRAAGAITSTSSPGIIRLYTAPVNSVTPVVRLSLESEGEVVVGSAAIATNATGGFLYIPSCAGTPTGAPTAYTGRLPLVIDSTNHKLYFYSGGAWRDAGP